MYDNIEYIIRANRLSNKTYVEPFAGGFAVGLELLRNGIVPKAIINDIDFHIYAFWKAVFCRTEALIDKINSTPVTIEEWKKQRNIYEKCDKRSLLKVAFSTLFLNRTNFSGVIKGGPIGGFAQKGKYKLDCRFSKKRLSNIISEISQFRDRIEIYNLDAKCFINDILSKRQKEIFVNFDPPYVKKGKCLYTNFYNSEDHKELGTCILKDLKCDWIMTYDNEPLIKEIYRNTLYFPFDLDYSANKHVKATELFISGKNYSHNIKFSVA